MATDFSEQARRIRPEDALAYHSEGRKGKIEVVPTKPLNTVRDLALAYSPGVAEPSRVIARDEEQSYQLTARGNLVAVLSNGTAVLGLGDIGPHAAKPVMEGKGVLFKKFADIDVFDIEINVRDPEDVIRVCKALEPTFGGINLEDIKAPDCFIIEERLKAEMQIPVFHDDQHGTAIISGGALLNALELCGKEIGKVRIVTSGAGAAAIACSNFYISLGVDPRNLLMVDTKGVIYEGRTEGMNKWKARFTQPTSRRSLKDALEGADVFLGCSVAGLLTAEMVKSMAQKPIIFALANPDPEIPYGDAKAARPDAIVATGRSDYPNQVNNVLGFPFIFRGALDVRARGINEEMKLAAARAIAALTREEVPESVSLAYGGQKFRFGPDYIIPKPFDPRVLHWVAPAVAKAAMDSGVARTRIDLDEYRERLKKLQGRAFEVMRAVFQRARKSKRRVVFPEGNHPRVLYAAEQLVDEGVCVPILIGPPDAIREKIRELDLSGLEGVPIFSPPDHPRFDDFVKEMYARRQRRGVREKDARKLVRDRNVFATLMLACGDADAMITGVTLSYPDAVRAPLQIVRTRPGKAASGAYIVVLRRDLKFFADCTINVAPTAEQLAEIAIDTADLARSFEVEPRIAFLSYSNFGSAHGDSPERMRRAVELLRARRPELAADGEMQVEPALSAEYRAEQFPFSTLQGEANVLIFPDLDSANISYKLMRALGGAEIVGPILQGMNKPVSAVPTGASVSEIVHLAALMAQMAG